MLNEGEGAEEGQGEEGESEEEEGKEGAGEERVPICAWHGSAWDELHCTFPGGTECLGFDLWYLSPLIIVNIE